MEVFFPSLVPPPPPPRFLPPYPFFFYSLSSMPDLIMRLARFQEIYEAN